MSSCNPPPAEQSPSVDPSGKTPFSSSSTSVRRFFAGILLSVLSALCFSVTAIIVKFVSHVPASHLALFRYIGIFLMSFPLMAESGHNWFGPNCWCFRLCILLRALFGATSLFFKFSSLNYISLANSTIIGLSSPIFVFIFARIFLNEPFGRYHAISLCLSLVGILFASKINSFFPQTKMLAMNTTALNNMTYLWPNGTVLTKFMTVTPTLSSASHSSHLTLLIGNMYAISATILGSMIFILIRKMSNVHYSVIMFNFSWLAIIEMMLVSYLFYDFNLPTTGYTSYLLFILALLSFYAQISFTKAIQIEEAGVVSVIRGSAEAIFSFLGDIIVFGDKPDMYSVIGATLVLFSVILLAFHKYVVNLPEQSVCRRRFRIFTYQ